MNTIKVGTAEATAAGRFQGVLEVGSLPDGAPIELPVVIVRGVADGPVLWMHGCVHGNEYCGTYSIHEFIRSLDPGTVKGAVVALPILNLAGFRSRQRSSPFELFNNTDMNRCFPGSPNGGMTEQMAYVVFEELKRNATHFVDFHTAYTPDTRWALFCDLPGTVTEVGRRMAEAFGYENTLPTPPGTLHNSALMAAGREGIPGYLVEAGGLGPAFSRETVLDVAERLRNLGRAIGLLSGEVTRHPALTTFSNFHWATAPRGGLFVKHVSCGDLVAEGQPIGTYYDVFGDEDGTATAPASGVVLAINPGPIIPQGDVLIHIGLDPRKN